MGTSDVLPPLNACWRLKRGLPGNSRPPAEYLPGDPRAPHGFPDDGAFIPCIFYAEKALGYRVLFLSATAYIQLSMYPCHYNYFIMLARNKQAFHEHLFALLIAIADSDRIPWIALNCNYSTSRQFISPREQRKFRGGRFLASWVKIIAPCCL